MSLVSDVILPAAIGWTAMVYVLETMEFRGALRFRQAMRRASRKQYPAFTPAVSLIIPFKGVDDQMEENVRAFLEQDYPDLEILFVADAATDESYLFLKKHARRKNVNVLIRDPQFTGCSGKVAALLTAVPHARGDVLAFADSDTRPKKEWLARLVEPLQDPAVGAATGCYWYVPSPDSWAASIRSAWNSAANFALVFDERRRFIIGGSFAIRKALFDRLHMQEVWTTELSDDASLRRALQEQHYRTVFVPQAIMPIFGRATWAGVTEWSTRWLAIVKKYDPGLVRDAALAYGYKNAVLFAALAALLSGFLLDNFFYLIGGLLVVPQLFNLIRAGIRYDTIKEIFPEYRQEFRRFRMKTVLADLAVRPLLLYNVVRAWRMKSIVWRGKEYPL